MPYPPILLNSNGVTHSACRVIPGARQNVIASDGSSESVMLTPNIANQMEDVMRQRHDEVKDFIAIASKQLSMLIEHSTQQTALLQEFSKSQAVQAKGFNIAPNLLISTVADLGDKPLDLVGQENANGHAYKEVTFDTTCSTGARICSDGKRVESVLARRVHVKDVDEQDERTLEDSLRKLDSKSHESFTTEESVEKLAQAMKGEGSIAARCAMASAALASFVRSDLFELFFGGVILANTIAMAVDMEYKGMRAGHKMDYPKSTRPPSWLGDVLKVVEELFLWAFAVELALKLIGLRKRFFVDQHNRLPGWNYLDGIIVLFGLVDRFVKLDFGMDPMIIRFVRLLKLARFAKMFRMAGSLHSMNLILKSVAASLGALFWSMLLLFMIQCVVGMFVSQIVQSFIEDDSEDVTARREVFRYYGTFSRTQFTMFEVTHANYANAARVLVDNVSETWAWFFVGYRCTVAFAFLQVIRAVFIQRTLKVADNDRDLVLHTRKAAMKELHKKLGDIYVMLDGSGDGTIDPDEFKALLNEEKTKIWLSALDIDCSDPDQLFELLDLDGDGIITKSEFTHGAAKLRGSSTQRDMYSMQALTERLEAKVDLLLPVNLRVRKHPAAVLDTLF